MTTKHQASRLEIFMWHENNNYSNNKNVYKVFLVLGHSYNAAWIQRLQKCGWDSFLKESANIKYTMYDKHADC